MIDQVFSQAPDANVIFYPYTTSDTRPFNDKINLDVREVPAHGHLVEVSTSKPKGATGSFQVLLSSAINWKGVITAGDWCVIYMSDRRLESLPPFGEPSSGEESGFKMLGIVRSVRRQESIDSNGVKRVRYLVIGQDFHSLLTVPIYINIHMTQLAQGKNIPGAGGLLIFGKTFKNFVKPNEVVKALVDSLLGRPAFQADRTNSAIVKNPLLKRQGEPYRIPAPVAKRVFGGKRAASNFFTGLLTFFLQKDLLGKYVNKNEIPAGVHSLWSVLESYSHRLLNELYTDMLPVNVPFGVQGSPITLLLPSLIQRAIPFSPSKATREFDNPSLISMVEAGGQSDKTGKAVATRRSGVAQRQRRRGEKKTEVGPGRGAHFYVSRDIMESEILAFNSGKSDRERFNFFLVSPNLGAGGVGEAAIVERLLREGISQAADQTSIARYGLRPYISQSNYLTVGGIDKNLLALNRIAQDLWGPAHLFESGQIMVVGSRGYIPVGTNIRLKQRDQIAHVEQVEHSFRVDETTGRKTFRTTISFSRLQTTKGGPVDAVETADTDGQLDVATTDGIHRGRTFTVTDGPIKEPLK